MAKNFPQNPYGFLASGLQTLFGGDSKDTGKGISNTVHSILDKLGSGWNKAVSNYKNNKSDFTKYDKRYYNYNLGSGY